MKKVTMLDIATRAGVSKATVSMVLNKRDENISEKTRKKILDIAEELNYIPNSLARSLSTKKTGTIGIILPDITNPFFASMARAIEDEASILGYNIIFCNSDNHVDKEKEYITLLISKLVDGVIFISGGKSSSSINMLKRNNVPFVLVDRYVENYNDYYGVYCLNKEGVYQGVEYLYNIGKRKIAFVKGPNDLEVAKARIEAYKEAVSKYNIYDSHLIFDGEFTIASGAKATEKILESAQDIDAIFYSNDIMALGGMKILLRRGIKIPQNISILGFDNIDISNIFEPELSTIGQPIYTMGKKSCRLLIDIINGVNIPQKQTYFKTELIIRRST